jgi:Tfp pilus assembly protein PilZ
MLDRDSHRFVPSRSVTVAFESRQNPTAYGVVANLSQGGACVWTDAKVEAGQHLRLSLTFAREPIPVPIEGRVVWTGPITNTPGRRCGLEWEGPGGPDRDRLQEMIVASALR